MTLSQKLKLAGVIALVIGYYIMIDVAQRKNAAKYELTIDQFKTLTD